MKTFPAIPSKRRVGAFTLIELLTVIAVISMLVTLLFPVLRSVFERTDTLKCMSNLRQIGMAAIAAATDNDNRFPLIEIDPKNPVFQPEDNAKPMLEALRNYGVDERILQCPSDMKTGGSRTTSSFVDKGSSYMWQPYAEDEPTQSITRYTPRGAFPAKLSRVRLASDWEALHPIAPASTILRMNVLYADGHVVTADQIRSSSR